MVRRGRPRGGSPSASRAVLAAATALALMMTGCSVGSIGGSGGSSVEITYLVGNGAEDVAAARAIRDGFVAEHPDITMTIDTRPVGVEGDKLIKTRLATGELADVFVYNSDSLFRSLDPDTTLTPLDGEPWVEEVSEEFRSQVTTPKGSYGAPYGTGSAGGVLYNKKLYEELGLKIPITWAQFMANNEKIKAAGKIAVAQTYGDPWTAQLFVLGDFANVAVKDPAWAEEYTENRRSYVDRPALQGFLNQAELARAGLFNRDFASARFDDGIRLIATGEAAHYPITTTAVGALRQDFPDHVDDIGVFALPAQEAATTRLTIWPPGALSIPKTTTGAKLDAARQLITFIESTKGCAIQSEWLPLAGPYSLLSCELPDDLPPVAADVRRYIDQRKAGSALEFLSPIKGPTLSEFTVEVGSGSRSAKDAAAAYDRDVAEQARALGLPGW